MIEQLGNKDLKILLDIAQSSNLALKNYPVNLKLLEDLCVKRKRKKKKFLKKINSYCIQKDNDFLINIEDIDIQNEIQRRFLSKSNFKAKLAELIVAAIIGFIIGLGTNFITEKYFKTENTTQNDQKRLIDTIREEADFHEIPNDWDFIIYPLIQAIKLEDRFSLEDKYVDAICPLGYYKYQVSDFLNTPQLRLGRSEKAITQNYSLFKETSQRYQKPIGLIGEAGVGKSTWLEMFFKYSLPRFLDDKVASYIYDHNSEKGNIYDTDNELEILKKTISFNLHNIITKLTDESGLDNHLEEFPIKNLSSESFQNFYYKECIKKQSQYLIENGYHIWIIIDNIDRYPSQLQKEAFSVANFLSKELGIGAVVPIRPYTYTGNSLHLGGSCVSLRPPDFFEVLRNRLSLIETLTSDDIDGHLKKLFKLRLDLKWTNGTVDNEEALIKIYKQIINKLSSNKTLTTLIQSLRHFNIRKSLRDVVHLMESGHFAEEIIDTLDPLKSKNVPSSDSVITSYLRGPYNHFRGRTERYLISIANIFCPPHIDEGESLVCIRILQILDKHTQYNEVNGIDYSILSSILKEIEYTDEAIINGLKFLLKRRLIKEITRLVDWKENHKTILANDDFIISLSGKYYMDYFLKKYSLRYLESMADTYYFSESVINNKQIKVEKDLNSIVNNAYYIARDVYHRLMAEFTRLSNITVDEKLGVTKLDLLFRLFNNSKGFYYNMIEESLGYIDKLQRNPKSNIKNEIFEKWKSLKEDCDKIYTMKKLSLEKTLPNNKYSSFGG